MNRLTVIVLLLVPLTDGEKIQNGRNQETGYATNRVRRTNQDPGIPRDWQWYLKDTSVSMGVESAWNAGYTGKGVIVAVVDDGVNMNHPDLRSNFNVSTSYDFKMDRAINRFHSPGSHGTKCAGIIAGGNNDNCGVGIAYNAKIAGIRIYDDSSKSTDSSEAKALSYKNQLIDIYSNSWGPGDMGWRVEGPGPLLTKAMEEGVENGRHGRGSIFVFAAGNGGFTGDSCAFNGYVNNIHTIAISGVNWDGSVPAFTEPCAGIMAVTYGKDMFTYTTDGNVKPPLITTEGNRGCTDDFPGTSANTALASGIIALTLQANQNLTWRDVQHLIVRSSRPLDSPAVSQRRSTPSWRTNAASLPVSKFYGFGLMDAALMIRYAKTWVSVPQQLSCKITYKISGSAWPKIPWTGQLDLTLSVNEHNCGIRFLEHVQVKIDLIFPRRGYLDMSSESPGGTQSKLLYSRKYDSWTGYKNFTNWNVTSLHYWGENPIGDWHLTIRNSQPHRNSRNVQDRLIDRVKRRLRSAPTTSVKIDGGYSNWSSWSQCTVMCGEGTQYRNRSCTNPIPLNGGAQCVGSAQETRRCSLNVCPTPGIPVNGNYSQWSEWSQCTQSCNGGTQNRRRECNNPRPANGGNNCRKMGQATQHRKCNTQNCPVDGLYSPWSSWSECSRTCNGGNKRRSRTCTNPPPEYGGRNCRRLGSATQSERCNTQKCPGYVFSMTLILFGTREDPLANNLHVDRKTKKINRVDVLERKRDIPVHGGWSQWSRRWSRCSKTCGGGTQTRARACTSPPPANRGRDCSGPGEQSRRCNTRPCPTPPTNAICRNTLGDSRCDSWRQYCNSHKYVRTNCAKTCDTCPVCKNSLGDSYCRRHAKNCSGSIFSGYCQKTCGTCKG